MRKYLLPDEIKELSLEEMEEKTKQELVPIYSKANTNCIHSLRYTWDGWGSENTPFPPSTPSVLKKCIPSWTNDGFKFENHDIKSDMIQCMFSVSPLIPPVKFIQKVKGRFDHAFRLGNVPFSFSRKVCFRSLGDNIRGTVNNYVKKQVVKSEYFDAYKGFLESYNAEFSEVDLSIPITKAHGRYWYNLHLVIVAYDRNSPVTRKENFDKINIIIPKIAQKKNCMIAYSAIMPDHIHISLKGNPEMSPYEIGLSFMNNLSYVLGYHKCWREEFYVGTFSEYSAYGIK